jgi:uncharacterized membrane protein YidH (DUF202 family)
VSSQSVPGGSKRMVVLVLAVLGALAIILGILFMAGATPSFLNSGSHVKHGGHLIRGGVCLAVGIVLGVGAWWQNKKS